MLPRVGRASKRGCKDHPEDDCSGDNPKVQGEGGVVKLVDTTRSTELRVSHPAPLRATTRDCPYRGVGPGSTTPGMDSRSGSGMTAWDGWGRGLVGDAGEGVGAGYVGGAEEVAEGESHGASGVEGRGAEGGAADDVVDAGQVDFFFVVPGADNGVGFGGEEGDAGVAGVLGHLRVDDGGLDPGLLGFASEHHGVDAGVAGAGPGEDEAIGAQHLEEFQGVVGGAVLVVLAEDLGPLEEDACEVDLPVVEGVQASDNRVVLQIVSSLSAACGRVEGVVDCAVEQLIGVEKSRLPAEDFAVDLVEDELAGEDDPGESGVGLGELIGVHDVGGAPLLSGRGIRRP